MSMDLNRPVSFRGFALNTVAGDPAVGCTIDTADLSDVEVRQFVEPLSLQDGYTVGPVYLGARRVALTGTIYDLTRGAAYDRLASLNAALLPTAEYIAAPASFGFAALTFYEATTGGPLRTLYVRSGGLRVRHERTWFGGSASDPLAIPWSVTFIAKNPAIA